MAPGLPRVLLAPGPGWLCSFGVFSCVPVCLSSLPALGTSLSTSPGVPAALPGPQSPPEVPSLTARDPTSGPEPWVQQARPASPARPLLPTPPGKGDLQPQLDSALQDVNDMYLLLEETEKQAVRRALIEERGRFCTFITFLQPVVVGPVGTRRPS